MALLQQIDCSLYRKLDADDRCFYVGEYTAHGGFGASETNNQIFNLKKKPSCSPAEFQWKLRAINYWGDLLAQCLNLDALANSVTLIPAPSSRLAADPDHDNRMYRVLLRLAGFQAGADVREVVRTIAERPAQHSGDRLSVEQLQATMAIDPAQIVVPLRPIVLVVDDVITQGGTFKAIKNLIAPCPGVEEVCGVFLAKTIWQQPDYAAIFEDLTQA